MKYGQKSWTHRRVPLFQGSTGPLLLLGSLLLVQRQKFSWVAKDNKAVTLDWGRESTVFLCCPFMLQTINMVTLPACDMKYRIKTGTEKPSYLSADRRYSTPLPIWKHVSRWIHKYSHCSCFDVETSQYIDVNNTGNSERLFIKSSSRGVQGLHTLNGFVSVHLTKLYQLNWSPALLWLNPSKSY